MGQHLKVVGIKTWVYVRRKYFSEHQKKGRTEEDQSFPDCFPLKLLWKFLETSRDQPSVATAPISVCDG